MLDSDFIRNNADEVKRVIASGRSDPEKADIDRWLELDAKRRELLSAQDELNREKNELAKIGKEGGDIEKVRAMGREVKERSQKLAAELDDIVKEWQEILDWVPNMPLGDMPEGAGEEDNLILRAWTPDNGYLERLEGLKARGNSEDDMPRFPLHADKQDYKPRHHLDLGEALGVIDNKQAAKVSGTRFTYLLGDLALMQFAIQRMFFDKLLASGFRQIIPPLLVREPALYGSTHIPEGRDQIYRIDTEFVEEGQQLYLLGSSEPANFSYYMDKVLDESELPIKLFAYTSCFRSEAGSWGKDTKGIKRLHQFDKIEMNVVSTPEKSGEVFDELLGINEWLLQELKLPYQLALKCTGDAGYHASAKQVDPEVWLAGQGEFIEVMTDTNATDFQARRMNIKYKTQDGKKRYVHTVNDTGVAMGRMLISIMDNYQQSDGTIKVPEVLRSFMGREFVGR
ncbi:MAG: serine--tRNA ligase [Candidatus Dojkabacteria bacterium]